METIGRLNPVRISRARRQEIAQGARRIYSLAHASGRTVDAIQDELLRSFPGELASGEARMYAQGWTVRTVRDGLQSLAAERGMDCSDLQDADIWRWLRGEVYPRESLERLCRLFRCDQARLGWPARGNEEAISFDPGPPGVLALARAGALVASGNLDGGPSGSADGRPDWPTWFGVELAHLLTLIDQWPGQTPNEPLQLLVHQEVLMFDAARPADVDPVYQPSRRQMLVTLLALPVALTPSLLGGQASTIVIRKLLAQCAASITAAWHLLAQSDFSIVEQHVSGYLLALTTLARQPSAHQQEAARLASMAYRSLGIVALHRRQLDLKDHYAGQALLYAEIAADQRLQWAALTSYCDTALLYWKDPARAADTYQRLALYEAQATPLMRARYHATAALIVAMEGRDDEPKRHLEVARETYPATPASDPIAVYGEFRPCNLILYCGLTQLAMARRFPDRRYQDLAWETFDSVGRLAGQEVVTERVRIEIVTQQAATAVEMRDLERFVSYLRAGVEGAVRLQSAQRLHEARSTWQHALQVWPTERRVTALAELFAASPGQLSAGRG